MDETRPADPSTGVRRLQYTIRVPSCCVMGSEYGKEAAERPAAELRRPAKSGKQSSETACKIGPISLDAQRRQFQRLVRRHAAAALHLYEAE